jgi:hypothetical protein
VADYSPGIPLNGLAENGIPLLTREGTKISSMVGEASTNGLNGTNFSSIGAERWLQRLSAANKGTPSSSKLHFGELWKG